MKVLLDSSTLIAAMLPDHVHHTACHAWLSHAKSGAVEFVVAGHSLAEVYSVLTRLPARPASAPVKCGGWCKRTSWRGAQIVALTGKDYVALVDELSRRSVGGGLVYDAIIARTAALAQVDRLVTLNTDHFLHVWPDRSNQITSPLQVTPPN